MIVITLRADEVADEVMQIEDIVGPHRGIGEEVEVDMTGNHAAHDGTDDNRIFLTIKPTPRP